MSSRERKAQRLDGIVLPVGLFGLGVGGDRRVAAGPRVVEGDRSRIPEADVREHRGHGPTTGHVTTQLGIARAPDERAQALTLDVVLCVVSTVRER